METRIYAALAVKGLKMDKGDQRESENAGDDRTLTDTKFVVYFPVFSMQNE